MMNKIIARLMMKEKGLEIISILESGKSDSGLDEAIQTQEADRDWMTAIHQ